MTVKHTIFLHIGMHKTATTSIQASLQDFTDGTTRYARLGQMNHSIPLLAAFATAPERHHFYAIRGLDAAAVAEMRADRLARLQAELDSPEPNLILSGEALVDLAPPELAAMKAMLDDHASRIRVLAYLREPVGFAASAFQQQIKSNHTQFSVPKPRYRARFRRFFEVFGPRAMEFAPFDPPRFRDQCIITDFCDRVGIDASRVPKRRSNASLSTEVVGLLLDWNRSGLHSLGSPARVQARSQLINRLRTAFPGKFTFAPDLAAAHRNAADCAWIERKAGFPLPAPSGNTENGVRDEADLLARARATRPALAALIRKQGLISPDPEAPTSAFLDVLYRPLLAAEETRQNAGQKAGT